MSQVEKHLTYLCDALHISIDDIVDYGKSEDKTFLMLFHLSVLSFMILPLLNIVLTIVFAIRANKGNAKVYYPNFKWLRILR